MAQLTHASEPAGFGFSTLGRMLIEAALAEGQQSRASNAAKRAPFTTTSQNQHPGRLGLGLRVVGLGQTDRHRPFAFPLADSAMLPAG